MKKTSSVHNASACTVDGSKCWIATLRDPRTGQILDTEESDTEDGAWNWLILAAQRRAIALDAVPKVEGKR